MQGRFRRGRSRLKILAPWTCVVCLGLGTPAWAATPAQESTPPGRAAPPTAPPPQSPTIPPDLLRPTGLAPAQPVGTGEPLQMEKGKEEDPAKKERCDRASYIVRQANELGDETPLAISYVQRALDICPDHPGANIRMGIILFRQKKNEEARKSFERALKEGGRIPEVQFNLGIFSKQDKKDAQALGYFRRAAELEPGNAAYLYNLGVIQAQMKERGQAIDSLRKTLQANPKMAEAHFFLGALLQEMGQREEAREALQQSVRLNPKLALPHIYLAAIHEAEGKSQSAQQELSQAVRLNPASIQVGYSLDDFYAKEGGANDFLLNVGQVKQEAAALSIPPGEEPPQGGRAPSPGFGPRREAQEVPATQSKKTETAPPAPARQAPSPPRREAPAPPQRTAQPSGPAKEKAPPGPTYRVRPGDTLAAIASRHGTRLETLVRLNRDTIEHPSMLEPGQIILLPAASKGPRPAASRPAQRAPSPPALRREPSPGEPYRLHRVQRGETLARIARRYRTTVEQLMRLNRDRIEHPSMIQVGQQIRVPAPPATRSRAPAPAKAPAAGKPAPGGPPAQERPPRAPASAPASP